MIQKEWICRNIPPGATLVLVLAAALAAARARWLAQPLGTEP